LDNDLEVFRHGGSLVGATRVDYIDDAIFNKLKWYVLYNCEEADIYRE
jgi:hypothetical protein